ncbi:GDP-mannose transporter into the lumen of the Golgi [Tilletia horrida]|uniref:GDP-mannose transporter n=1 Tax=Tilletia horrida TaxID=155126 RepID=A0AAN6GFT6_9BASI|nr:GDP-mannose transporter into the lumen of the Golgi [Tilletia horrida]KAK0540228.1 GDP-mannose transporter into the lumen of the Golgi [Tilletia horrida]
MSSGRLFKPAEVRVPVPSSPSQPAGSFGNGNGNGNGHTPYPPHRPDSPSGSDRTPFLESGGRAQGGATGLRVDPRLSSLDTSSGTGLGSTLDLRALPPILSYCASSIAMTVVNKYVLSGKKFNMNLLVLLCQSLVGVTIVTIASRMKLIQIRPLNAKDAKAWLPVSALLVAVIFTGSKALQFLNMAVYTIFKNLTIILIAYGEVIWFGGRVTALTFMSFVLMVLSSIIAASSDIARVLALNDISVPHDVDAALLGATYDPVTKQRIGIADPLAKQKAEINAQLGELNQGQDVLDGLQGVGVLNSGYVWMALNCFASAAYVLYMRKRIKLTGFKDWDSMFYNNLLSIPILVVSSLLTEDWSRKNLDANFPAAQKTHLLTAIAFSGACAVFISYTTAWCIRTTSSTTYSMVGALNKLPLALSGMIFLGEAVTLGSTGAIAVGFLAGLVYAYAKNLQSQAQRRVAGAMAATGYRGSGSGADGSASPHGNKPIIPLSSLDRHKD